jgi:ABC-type transport system involved in multi-copper enzyme maturation permease subunit
MGQLLSQMLAVIRLELRKTFFARRGLWVYLLALAPAVLYFGHSVYAPREQQRLVRLARRHPIPTEALESISRGHKREDVIAEVGQPYWQRTDHRRFGPGRWVQRDWYKYTDGKSDFTFVFFNGELSRMERNDPDNLSNETVVFATLFQLYYVRLAIFFGCVGIFVNLFRGELLDKSLHFYLLTPVRREVLLAGKFIAGLGVAVLIFAGGAALQLAAMLWEFKGRDVGLYLSSGGWGHLGAYLFVTVLACVGYGVIFLAAGLLFSNPIVPAAIVLIWESANLFVPGVLKKISVIYYLQTFCPVAFPQDSGLAQPLRLLVSTAEPATRAGALIAIGGLAVVGFVVAAQRARSLEINYSAE